MERLTHKNGEGFIVCDDCEKPHCNKCETFREQAMVLSLYENSGLTPVEVMELASQRVLTKQKLLELISAERVRQDKKWGCPQDNTYCEWSSILAEECGELAKELNELNFGRGDVAKMTDEAIQVAAVALAILEQHQHAAVVTSAWRTYRSDGKLA